MKNSLWLKLMGAFLLTILVGGGIDSYLVSRSTSTQFSLYISENGNTFAQQLVPILTQYYAQQGSWQGVETILNNPWGNSTMMNGSMGMMGEDTSRNQMMDMSGPWSMMGIRFLLTDTNGSIIADSSSQDTGGTLPSSDLEAGIPIKYQNQSVGYLFSIQADANLPGAAGTFVSSVNHFAWLSGIITALFALLLGSVLFFQIISPIQKLTAASKKIAGGELSQRIPVQSQDEIGQLALTFNQMADSLAKHEELRRNLIADVAHELRTPLTVIQGNLEAMMDGLLPPDLQEIATLRDEAALLSRLVADLRLLSLAEAGQLKLELVKTDPAELVTRAVESFRLQAQTNEMQLNLEFAPDLPQIEVDVDRMTQVIRNLLSNALRHTPEGGQIAITCQTNPDRDLFITVSDTGEGISPGDLPYIFDRFYRTDKSRSRVSGGSGIGLAIVKQLVEAHGGKVWVTSKPGQGTTFGLTLPVS